MQTRVHPLGAGRAVRRSFVVPVVVQHADLGELTLQSRHFHGDPHRHTRQHCGFDHYPDGTPKL